MRNAIWCPYRECSIQDACQEGHTSTPAGGVVKVFPDERVAGMFVRHCRYHDNCDNPSNDDHEQAELLQDWKVSVEEDRCSDAQPGNADKRDEIVPWLRVGVFWVVDTIHAHDEL